MAELSVGERGRNWAELSGFSVRKRNTLLVLKIIFQLQAPVVSEVVRRLGLGQWSFSCALNFIP